MVKIGKKNVVRSRTASNEFFTSNNRYDFLSYFLSVFAIFKVIRRKHVFNKYLNFNNVNRWNVLKKNEYIFSWVENILKIYNLSMKKKCQVYLLEYPSLVNLFDTPQDRNMYIKKTRLTEFHAEYQAISKHRISNVLKILSKKIKLLDVNKFFHSYRGLKRLELFDDEIHYTALGNQIFGEKTAKLLNSELILKNKKNKKITSLSLNKFTINNPMFLNRIIDRMKIKILNSNKETKLYIPSDRYTTY